MATHPLSPEKKAEAIEQVRLHGNVGAAARAMGLAYTTLERRYKQAIQDPAITEAMAAVKTDLVPALAWAKTKSEGGTSYSVLLKPRQEPEDIAELIREKLLGLPPVEPVQPPELSDADLCTLIPLADAHVGMMTWGQETGEDYDTRIATDRVRTWIARAVDALPPASLAVILDVGDLTHADDQTNQTPKSKHVLDVDTRHFRTLDMTIAALAYAVEYALRRNDRVLVRILPGNHNATSYMAVLFALAERYRNKPRVEVQKIPGEFFVMEFGEVMLAAHHGDKSKADRMTHYLADAYAPIWGRTKHRFLWTGHLHHHKSQDIGGLQWEQLRALTARDAYAVSHAYCARSQLQGVVYHKTRGEVMRVKIAA